MRHYMLVCMLLLAACTRGTPNVIDTVIILFASENPTTRAGVPDEEKVSDWNLLIFNAFGDLEEQVYIPARSMDSGRLVHTTRLLRDVPYTLVAAANMGFRLPFRSLAEAKAFRYYMAHPDEYAEGIPMATVLENICITEEMPVRLERLMARIDRRLDRREQDSSQLLKVTEVSIGNSPSSVSLFPGSRLETASQAFQPGFTLRDQEVEALNRDLADGLSGTVYLYLLENVSDLHESYLEIKAEYHSEDQHTAPGERLTFRLPLGEVLRNRVYPINVSVPTL